MTYVTKQIGRAYTYVVQSYQHIWLDHTDLRFKQPSNAALISAIVWALEWLILVEYMFGEWTRTNLLCYPRVPTIMAFCLLYWFWLWGMAVWRRTQYGKFTRGERKLWAKAITAFWVAELVTVASFILVYAWLPWGPVPLVYRIFAVSRKGIILEFIIFSYILFLAHAAKHLLKWNAYQTQVTLTCLIMCLLSYLFWKDAMLLILRENLALPTTARWRNIRTTAVVYTLSHDWWTHHLLADRAPHALYPDLKRAFLTKQRPDFSTVPVLTEFQQYNTVLSIHKAPRAAATFPLLNHLIDYTHKYNPHSKYYQPTAAYPRRLGFVPKRLAMWHLLMILKMWHHTILLIWWTLYAYRLLFRRKTSYSFLSSCYFNVYCCLILAGLIYLTYLFPRYEVFLKIKPHHVSWHRLCMHIHAGWYHIIDLLLYWNQQNATPGLPT